jgi:hypothetical protein
MLSVGQGVLYLEQADEKTPSTGDNKIFTYYGSVAPLSAAVWPNLEQILLRIVLYLRTAVQPAAASSSIPAIRKRQYQRPVVLGLPNASRALPWDDPDERP